MPRISDLVVPGSWASGSRLGVIGKFYSLRRDKWCLKNKGCRATSREVI
jgi:hypothetical protein